MTVLLLLTGLLLIIGGANFLTDSASSIARRLGISEFVVGLTIVAIGTSTPELVISLISAIKGNSDIAIGNVVGSNMFNTLIIIGITAILTPFTLTSDNVRKDIPLGIFASLVLLIATGDLFINNSHHGIISRSEGLLMLCLFGLFIGYSVYFMGGRNKKKEPVSQNDINSHRSGYNNMFLSGLIMLVSLIALVFGGELFLHSSIQIARNFGISESVIAVTIIAGGTSLPELAASVVAAVKKKPGLAFGNALGSNITNIFLVLGASAAASPLTLGEINIYDIFILLAVSVLLWFMTVSFKKSSLGRMEGIVFLILYVMYVWWMIVR